MSLTVFLRIVQLFEQAIPVGMALTSAITQLFVLLKPTHPDTGIPLTEVEVHAAIAGARTVWQRIADATQPPA